MFEWRDNKLVEYNAPNNDTDVYVVKLQFQLQFHLQFFEQ